MRQAFLEGAFGLAWHLEYNNLFTLVGGWATPLKNIGQLGWLETQYFWENKIDVPNHQPEHYFWGYVDDFENTRNEMLKPSATNL